ncbi:MAG: nucleotide exchange factor GrpE [Anaerolineae bacterium]
MTDATPPVTDVEEIPTMSPEQQTMETESEAVSKEIEEGKESLREAVEMWRDRALRLEAEIDNFRKRQRRLSDDRVAADRERLLRAFLGVADNLARALTSDGQDSEGLRAGVDLTYQSLMRLLKQEGVERIEAEGQLFDPLWHEAVSTVSHEEVEAEPETVVEVVQPGYRLGDRLLRPARVVVAT